MMLLAMLLAVQAATTEVVATCRIPDDPEQRTWTLERRDAAAWQIAFRSRSLDQPRTTLPLPDAAPATAPDGIRLSYQSANGGRAIDWRIAEGPSTLDLHVSHGLEVNVERDLDPAVELMNTDGPIAVTCAIWEPPQRRADGVPPLSGVPPPSGVRGEWTIGLGAARSVNLFESTGGRGYAVQTIGWGRDLTRELGPGALRGRFAWAVEVMPVFAQFEPSAIYGFGIAPVVWRWNFMPRPRWSAFAELSMGGLWTTDPIPEDAGAANFTAHWGGGVRLLPRGAHALVLAYRFQHFSNGNQLGDNPGVNSHVVLIGWSYRS